MPQGHPQRSEGDRQQPHPNHMPQLPLMQPLMQPLIYSQAHLQQFPQHQPQQPYTQQHLQPQQQNQPQQQIQHLEPGTDKARVSAARSKDMYITTPLLTKLFGRKSESEDLPGVRQHPPEILAPPVALGGRKADRGRVRRRTEETGGGLLLAKRARDAAAVGGRTIVSGDKSSQKAGLVEVSNPSVLGKPVDLRCPKPEATSTFPWWRAKCGFEDAACHGSCRKCAIRRATVRAPEEPRRQRRLQHRWRRRRQLRWRSRPPHLFLLRPFRRPCLHPLRFLRLERTPPAPGCDPSWSATDVRAPPPRQVTPDTLPSPPPFRRLLTGRRY